MFTERAVPERTVNLNRYVRSRSEQVAAPVFRDGIGGNRPARTDHDRHATRSQNGTCQQQKGQNQSHQPLPSFRDYGTDLSRGEEADSAPKPAKIAFAGAEIPIFRGKGPR